MAWQSELVEVRAQRRGRNALVAKVADGRMLGSLGELLPVVTEQKPVMDHLGQLAPERPRDPLLHLFVRPVVGAADDVGDPEVEIVDNRCELVGRGAVRPRKRRPRKPDRAVHVTDRACLESERRRLGVTLCPFALPDRPLLPGDAEPAEVAQNRLLAAGNGALGVGVVDAQHEDPAVLVRERPVGDGAERVAEVERPGRARREADANAGAHASIVMWPGWPATRSSQARIAGYGARSNPPSWATWV